MNTLARASAANKYERNENNRRVFDARTAADSSDSLEIGELGDCVALRHGSTVTDVKSPCQAIVSVVASATFSEAFGRMDGLMAGFGIRVSG